MTQDVLDRFLKEISYKFPKGYPDMEDPQDVNFLNELVMEYTEKSPKDFKQLKFGDLTKKQGARLEKVANLINDKHPFMTVDGKKVPLEFDLDSYMDLFSQKKAGEIKQLSTKINQFPLFKDQEGNKYTINDLVKSPELGGKGKGSGTEIQDAEIESLNNQITKVLQQEQATSLTVEVGGKKYQGITHAASVPGNPKADFTLNSAEGPQVFISHKDSKFHQYGGFRGLENHPEIKAFVQDVIAKSGGELESAEAYIRPIEDESIKLKAIYGINQGEKAQGIHNCAAVLQGGLKLTSEGDYYKLEADQEYINPTIPEGEYEPYLTVTFRNDRTSSGLKNARFGIYPKGFRPTATEI